ncbi:UvrD-helicase domain-containing protein [Peribacillus simplex]|uniref:UvrD-helicase domain-containing protein n=1 Tax=Peribacillus simplex TaxID=1478 RepID=UPI00203C981E|nr:UvrD-helicase domain-containing protein [Peribacillus simplex]MCM3673204.1 UvrD-helicase domain-containing protein [Peribacillus simplex]
MEFTNLDYKKIEDVLLNGAQLNPLQKEFIELFETKTIVAGPGTGKTTSLAAKIALMMIDLKRRNKNEGICIITHTNVAVNEINNALQKAGVGKIKHPHFIGTIHEFFNKFCVLPLFRIGFKNNSLNFPDQHKRDHDNIDTYISLLSRKYTWMNADVKKSIARRIDRSRLIINYHEKKIDLENTTNWDKFDKYKQDMLTFKLKRKSQGFITHNDTFLFSEYFLFSDKMVGILRSRFKYIFIDEYQDTNKHGERLLDKLFKTEFNVIQKIGDPFQTIGYGESMPDIKKEDIFKLNVSNRFGRSLGNHLNILIPEAQIETIEENNSFNPILLVFKNPENVGMAYYSIINELSKELVEFNNCKKRDSILVLRKETTNKYFNIKYKEDKKKKKDSVVSELKKLIISFIHKKIMEVEIENSRDVRNWISSHGKIQDINSLMADMLRVGLNETLIIKLRDQINSILIERTIKEINKNNQLFKEVNEIIIGNIEESDQDQIENQISTIHSVKGETHRSVLLLDFEEKPLTNILMSRYISNSTEDIDIIYRNLLYVAMSRASHLFIFAINEEELTDEVETKFKSLNWDVRYIQEFV